MKVCVCELPDRMTTGESSELAAAIAEQQCDLLVLPELAGTEAFWVHPTFNEDVWLNAVSQTSSFVRGLGRFAAKRVIGSRAIQDQGRRFNETYFWSQQTGLHEGRAKAWLPEMDGAWEATWFHCGPKEVGLHKDDTLCSATLLCTELLVSDMAQTLGKAGVQLIAVPRATGGHPRWEVATRMAAISAGAFVVTSNRRGDAFAGGAWVIGPDGEFLGCTDKENPILTLTIDLRYADLAKRTYPRNVVSYGS